MTITFNTCYTVLFSSDDHTSISWSHISSSSFCRAPGS